MEIIEFVESWSSTIGMVAIVVYQYIESRFALREMKRRHEEQNRALNERNHSLEGRVTKNERQINKINILNAETATNITHIKNTLDEIKNKL